MNTLNQLQAQREAIEKDIEKARKKEYKKQLKDLVKEFKIPAVYLEQIAERIRKNPGIYS